VLPLPELLQDPGWLPTALGQDYRTIQFGRVSREALSQEAFLDKRMSGAVSATQSHARDDVIAQSEARTLQLPAFIFHSAFCCSTLLARALDVPGQCLALKEPDVLMGLANALRTEADSAGNDRLADVIFGLLGRRFSAAESVLVKPTNAANNLLPQVVDRGARTLILYGDLRSFLVSVLKKGEACKAFVRTQYNIFGLDRSGLASIPSRQAMTFTDLQVAALVWRHQLELFERTLSGSEAEQVRSLDFRVLVAKPAQTLVAVAQHLDLPHDRQTLEEIASGPVFSRNAKFADQAYNIEQRASDAQAIEQQYGEVLDQVDAWARQMDLGTAFDLPLKNALSVPA
jgi:hypothetical protein